MIDYATPARQDWNVGAIQLIRPRPAPWPEPCPVRTLAEPRHCFHPVADGIGCCACRHRLLSIEAWAKLLTFTCRVPRAVEQGGGQ